MNWANKMQHIGDKTAARMRRAFISRVDETRSKTAWSEVAKAIPHGYLATYNAIHWGQWKMTPLIGLAYFEMATAGRAYLNKIVKKEENADEEYASLKFDFEMDNPAAISWIENYSAMQLRDMANQDMLYVRDVLARGMREKLTYKQIAKQLQQTIGLTHNQTNAYLNYTNNLREKGRTGSQVQSLGDKYYNKLLKNRAETIALTESHTASNMAWKDEISRAVHEGVLNRRDYQLAWYTSIDERRCPQCGALHGETAPVDADKIQGLWPPAHPRCRCVVLVENK
jgi:SPP1 gp7 family putative phage head morphogenesis protein